MTAAVTPGSEELRGEIAQALCCHGECIRGEAACWKYTTSHHKKITDAIVAIFDRLAAKPDEEGVREALEPFAQAFEAVTEEDLAVEGIDEMKINHVLYEPDYPTIGDLRKAHMALSPTREPKP
jgi:hypothetical protein